MKVAVARPKVGLSRLLGNSYLVICNSAAGCGATVLSVCLAGLQT